MRFVLSLLLFAAASASPVISCTLARKSLPKFDSNEYVFIGQVIGYTEPVSFDERKGNPLEPMSSTTLSGTWANPRKTVGLKVRVTEIVYLPKKAAEYFEIYSYDLGADCSTIGVSLMELKKEFPEGAEIRVIGMESVFLTEPAKAGTIRLENRPSELGSIALNTIPSGKRMTTAASVFDYKAYRYDMDRDSVSQYLLPNFELRKDMLRLESSRSAAYRRAILDRLSHAPASSDIELKSVFDTYAESRQEADRLYESYLEMSDPELYKAYKAVQRVTNELVRLGFQKKQADEAVTKALQSGTKVDYDDLIRETTRILKDPK